MFRYMGLIWNPANQRQSEAALLIGRRLQTAPQWQEVMNGGGMRVLCANARAGSLEPHLLTHDAGVVLGQLFARDSDPECGMPSRKAVLGPRQSASIVNSGGKQLISDYWGNYVAFLRDSAAARMWVIKDPAGALPCYSTVFREVTVFFSCIADCVELRLLHFTVNRSYLQDRVLRGARCQTPDALNEVRQLHRGECAEIDPRYHAGQMARHIYWNPLNFSASDAAIEDPERAARALRSTVRACTHAWAGCHASVLHRLSGGLDSSIISGCLAESPVKPRITSYIYYNPRALADERPWAQVAALHAGCEHVEHSLGVRDIRLPTMRLMRPSCEPVSVLGYIHRSVLDGPLAAQRAATAIFTGDGGNFGFRSNAGANAVTEYLQRHGLRREAFRIAAQVALCSHRSTFTVFSRSLRRWLLKSAVSQSDMPSQDCRLVNPDIVETLTNARHTHPWFDFGHAQHASFGRMEILPSVPDFYNAACAPDSQLPETISPLYSQPVIELCLRIPLYVHCEGGRDRGLARRAFSREVPKPILRRMRKEITPALCQELVRRNREFLRQLFLDGVLVGAGLLSRRAVEDALSSTPSPSATLPEEIFRHLDTEIWARHWTDKNARPSGGSTLREPFCVRGTEVRTQRG